MVGSQTRRHYENFPVASVFLPSSMRRHVAAVYAFARTADDFADEGDLPDGRRLELLEEWRLRLYGAVRGIPQAAPRAGEPADVVALFDQLSRTMRERALPVELFEALLSAFRQDVILHRYESWPQLLDYCSRSANPVGRLVLRIAGYREDRLDRWSDAVCTALQLTNFWQDLRMDSRRGRTYVPEEDMRAHGADRGALSADALTPDWRRLVAELVARTRRLFDEGRPVCDSVSGRLQLELRATWLGGMRILQRIEASDYDTLRARPVVGAGDAPLLLYRMLAWRRSSSS